MRLIYIGKSHAFSLLPLRALEEAHEVVGYVEAAPRDATPTPRWPAFAAARRALGSGSGMAASARRAGRPYLALTKDRPEALGSLLTETGADLLCIASLSQLLPETVLTIPKHGAVNLHPSLLPKYPGPFPVLWQYLAFEHTWGVTVHTVDAREDAGAILEQEPFEVATGTPLDELLARATAIGSRLMRKAVDDLAAGTSKPRPQAGERGPRARAVRPDEPLIDWDRWPIERVWHALRGTQPWLNALTHPRFQARDWIILEFARGESSGAPGSVGKDDAGYFAAHREGKIRLSLDRSWRARARRALRST